MTKTRGSAEELARDLASAGWSAQPGFLDDAEWRALARDAWSRWEDSSFVRASLVAGRSYRIVIRGDEDVVNMSSFAHFERYTGGLGGSGGAFNRVNIAELRIFSR